MEDSELVRRALQRDQQAFAALYDRYADRLFDYARRQTGSTADAGDIVQDTFVLAIQRLHQLRDPSLVRPWLYAIARSEVHRRHRRVNRLQFTEPDEQAAMTADGPTPDELVHQQELRALFTEAANGLDPADREVLDLHLRHQLSGAEIAAALGIPERQVSVTVQRVRERLARSIGVVLLARNPACLELAELQRTEGTPLNVLSRKRLARHIDGCATCAQQLHDRMRPETLLAALPIALAPATWRAEVLQRMTDAGGPGDGSTFQRPLRRRENTRVWHHADGFPRPATSLRLLGAVAVGVIAGLLLVGILLVQGGDSAKRVTAGAVTTAIAEKPSNTGGTGANDQVTDGSTDRTTTSSAASTTSTSSTTLPSTTLPSTTLPSTTLPSTTDAATVPPTVPPTPPPTVPPDTSPPTFQSSSASPAMVTSMHPDGSPMCSPTVEALTTTLSVGVTDDRGVVAVSVHFVASGVVGDRSLSKNGNVWQVTIGPFPEASVPEGSHPISVTFTAVDAAGNSKNLANPNIATLVDCPTPV